ncbi:Zinc finger GRF-type protein [Arachis hypogaea]|nr:Zinc finger GRF-type protein [Arachis hypogaea]
MLGSSSQDSGSSSRACLHSGWVKNAHRDRGGKIPHWCGCGLRPILRWSETDSNPKRPFYGYSNYNTTGKRWCDFFKWADVEEEEVIVGRNESSSGIGTNFINSVKRADVPKLAPCIGSTLKVVFLLDCSLSGLVIYYGGRGGSDGET